MRFLISVVFLTALQSVIDAFYFTNYFVFPPRHQQRHTSFSYTYRPTSSRHLTNSVVSSSEEVPQNDIETKESRYYDRNSLDFHTLVSNIRHRLSRDLNDNDNPPAVFPSVDNSPSYFIDTCTSRSGEAVLLSLLPADDMLPCSFFDGDDLFMPISVLALRGLLLLGMQFGNVGRDVLSSSPPSDDTENILDNIRFERNRRQKLWAIKNGHDKNNPKDLNKSDENYCHASDIAALKSRVFARSSPCSERSLSSSQLPHIDLAYALLSELKQRRGPKGAHSLLVAIGVWKEHECLVMLRSGVPVHFTEKEEQAAAEVIRSESVGSTHDPDSLLNIRRDLRRHKVYTIDSASTSEIDDGISLEVLSGHSSNNDDVRVVRRRIWIHIADTDRYAPLGSNLWSAAQRRGTSIYFPTGCLPMFPPSVGAGVMSLSARSEDCYALSLGVELNADGSVDASSIILAPSVIRVSYRLTYEQTDEMFEEGSAYAEEWQLGSLLQLAERRRQYRSSRGSSESAPYAPIPRGTVTVKRKEEEEAGLAVSLRIEVSHNAGRNVTTMIGPLSNSRGKATDHPTTARIVETDPVSPSQLLVTEIMILAGEALGLWGLKKDIILPYRCQPKMDVRTREMEWNYLTILEENNIGDGYCAAWYSRRFCEPVSVELKPGPHSGLGLATYVQWSSPIRRYCDLQVHSTVKQYLRREKIKELVKGGGIVPDLVSDEDIGESVHDLLKGSGQTSGCKVFSIDYNESIGLQKTARLLQNKSQTYWMLEFIRRFINSIPNDEESKGGGAGTSIDKKKFKAVVLGCLDANAGLYVIYLYDLGIERTYRSEARLKLEPGDEIWFIFSKIDPKLGILKLSAVSMPVGLGRQSKK